APGPRVVAVDGDAAARRIQQPDGGRTAGEHPAMPVAADGEPRGVAGQFARDGVVAEHEAARAGAGGRHQDRVRDEDAGFVIDGHAHVREFHPPVAAVDGDGVDVRAEIARQFRMQAAPHGQRRGRQRPSQRQREVAQRQAQFGQHGVFAEFEQHFRSRCRGAAGPGQREPGEDEAEQDVHRDCAAPGAGGWGTGAEATRTSGARTGTTSPPA
ncbi:conserved hypothetical protein, partial [Ricinus communis]